MANTKPILINIANHRRPLYQRILLFYATMIGIMTICFGPGILADSPAMQWAGFVIVIACAVLAIWRWDAQNMTIAEAREYLDSLDPKS